MRQNPHVRICGGPGSATTPGLPDLAQQPVIEARGSCRGSLEPSRDGGAGMARHSGGRRNADALDS